MYAALGTNHIEKIALSDLALHIECAKNIAKQKLP